MDKSKFDQLIEAVNSLVKKIKGGQKTPVTADDGTVLFRWRCYRRGHPVFADEAMTEAAEPGTYTEGTTTSTP